MVPYESSRFETKTTTNERLNMGKTQEDKRVEIALVAEEQLVLFWNSTFSATTPVISLNFNYIGS